jgi:hypothetical protein
MRKENLNTTEFLNFKKLYFYSKNGEWEKAKRELKKPILIDGKSDIDSYYRFLKIVKKEIETKEKSKILKRFILFLEN